MNVAFGRVSMSLVTVMSLMNQFLKDPRILCLTQMIFEVKEDAKFDDLSLNICEV